MRLVHALLARVGLCLVNEVQLVRLRAGINAHDEQFDEMTDRLVNVEARVAEFDVGKGAKAA